MEPYKHDTMSLEDYDLVSDLLDTMMSIYDEYDGAKAYIVEALKLKSSDKTRADTRVTMSAQELAHGETLSATVSKLLEKAKADSNPCYPTLAMVWNHIKRRQAEYAAWIKNMHETYKK